MVPLRFKDLMSLNVHYETYLCFKFFSLSMGLESNWETPLLIRFEIVEPVTGFDSVRFRFGL